MSGISNPIEPIVARFGGQSALARRLGTKQSTVWEWVNEGRVPSSRIPKIIEAALALDPPVVLQPNDFFGRTGAADSSRSPCSTSDP